MKDPLLQEYSVEELTYEFHAFREQEKAKLEQAEQEADKIEEEKELAAQSWADQMEAEDEGLDPSKDAVNAKWMEEQIKRDKEAFGEDFGEDLTLDFDSSNLDK